MVKDTSREERGMTQTDRMLSSAGKLENCRGDIVNCLDMLAGFPERDRHRVEWSVDSGLMIPEWSPDENFASGAYGNILLNIISSLRSGEIPDFRKCALKEITTMLELDEVEFPEIGENDFAMAAKSAAEIAANPILKNHAASLACLWLDAWLAGNGRQAIVFQPKNVPAIKRMQAAKNFDISEIIRESHQREDEMQAKYARMC